MVGSTRGVPRTLARARTCCGAAHQASSLTDPFTVAVASFAAGLAALIGWLSRSRVPELEGERWFKVVLAQLVTGRCEQQDCGTEQWMSAVKAAVPYHPAGRFPEKKVSGLGLAGLPAAEEGERALVEHLAKLPDLAARWAWMYDEHEAGLAARLDDPHELGPDYDPARLGTRASWDALVDWGGGKAAFGELLAAQGLVWVLVDGEPASEPAVLDGLEELVPKTIRVPFEEVGAGPLERAVQHLEADPAVRLVLVGQGSGIQVVLRALVKNPGLRDRVLAVVSVGARLGGTEALTDWMGAHFAHHELDTESARTTAYLALQWLDRTADPPGAFGLELRHARFPQPRLDAMTEEKVQTVDLGVLPADSDPELVAKGLWAMVTLWVDAQLG